MMSAGAGDPIIHFHEPVSFEPGFRCIVGHILGIVFPSVFFVFGLVIVGSGPGNLTLVLTGLAMLAFGGGMGGYFTWCTLRQPHTITIHPDGVVELVGLLGRERLSACDLRSVEENQDDDGPAWADELTLRHRDRTITCWWGAGSDIDTLAARLTTLNPAVRILRRKT